MRRAKVCSFLFTALEITPGRLIVVIRTKKTTQIDNSHLLLGMVQGIKRSMETVEKEMKRIKEQNVALDKKVSSVLKKHDNIEKQLKSLESKSSKVWRKKGRFIMCYYIVFFLGD